MSRAKQAADRVRKEIPIVRVLADYGYHVHSDGGDREQQFQCDLHGDGLDNKPSARVYPDSDSWYCFACSRSRDAIQTVREKEGIGFWPAVRRLEGQYGLPVLPWEPDEPRPASPQEDVAESLGRRRTWEDEQKRVRVLLDTVTEERDLSMDYTLALWEAFDAICWRVHGEHWTEGQGKQAVLKLRGRVLQRLKESPCL